LNKIGSKIDEVRIDGSLEAFKRDMDYYEEIHLDAVEIPVHGLDAIKNGRLDKRRVHEIINILKDFDFEYSVHAANPLNLMDGNNFDMHLSVFRSSLEFCSEIGSKILVYHCGRFIPEETFHIKGDDKITEIEMKTMLERERHYLIELSAEFPEISICLENARPYLHHSPYCYGEIPERIKEEIEKMNRKNILMTLDIGHLNMASNFYGFDFIESVNKVRHIIGHVHAHDNFGGVVYHYEKQQTHQLPFGRGDSHMPVGWGSIPIRDIISILLPEYKGLFIMELRSRYFENIRESKDNLALVLHDFEYTRNIGLRINADKSL